MAARRKAMGSLSRYDEGNAGEEEVPSSELRPSGGTLQVPSEAVWCPHYSY